MYKNDFPLLVFDTNLAYLDSGATSQKPQCVIDAVSEFYARKNSNIHRGIYKLSENATIEYEGVREKVKRFINAESSEEIVLTSGATESINLVAGSLSKYRPWSNEEEKRPLRVLLSVAEHHANIIPWQLNGCELKTVKYDSDFRLDIENYKSELSKGVDLVAINHVSNVLGTVNPIKEIVDLAHGAGARVLVDGAQAVPHLPVNVRELGADFYVFSGHKMCGPTGTGVLYAKMELLDSMEPIIGGGDMVERVGFDVSEWTGAPWKFEPGTPNIAGIIGLGRAIDYLYDIGFDEIRKKEVEIGKYALEKISRIDGLRLYGPDTMTDRVAVFSFAFDGIHAHDIASILDERNIAVRAGHHCCMPLHDGFINQPATVRASLYIYNEKNDIDRLADGLEEVKKILK